MNSAILSYARERSRCAAIVMITPIISISTTPYAAAVPKLKSRSSEAIAIEMGAIYRHKHQHRSHIFAQRNHKSQQGSGDSPGPDERKRNAREPLPPACPQTCGRFLKRRIELFHTGLHGPHNQRHEAKKIDYRQDPEGADEYERSQQQRRSDHTTSAIETATTVPGSAQGTRISHESSRLSLRLPFRARSAATQKLQSNAAPAAIADIDKLLRKTSLARESENIFT